MVSTLHKKAAIVIAFKDFRDEEYFIPKQILENGGVKTETYSNKTGEAIGVKGGVVLVDYLIEDLNPLNFDAVIFVGGAGCIPNLDNERSYKIIRETIAEDKLLASICISPIILAKAGALKNKRAVVWSSDTEKSSINILKDKGATYEEKPVVEDGKIITAHGPEAAKEFGEAIVKALS